MVLLAESNIKVFFIVSLAFHASVQPARLMVIGQTMLWSQVDGNLKLGYHFLIHYNRFRLKYFRKLYPIWYLMRSKTYMISFFHPLLNISLSSIIRAFKNTDISSYLGNSAPDTYSVYAISKVRVLKLKSVSQPFTPNSSRKSPHSRCSPDIPACEDFHQ